MNYKQVSHQYTAREDVIELSKKEEMALRKVLMGYLDSIEGKHPDHVSPIVRIELVNSSNFGHTFNVKIKDVKA